MFLFVHCLTAKVYTHLKAVDKLQQFVEQCFQVCLEAGVNKPTFYNPVVFTALMLLVGRQEEHPSHKN